jgi:HSP20 family molecular chaperone IbpA
MRPPAAARECVALHDLADCLLDAYDSVTRRAYHKFIERGGRPGGEVDDWLSSEREILLSFPVDIEESAKCVYALASVPDPAGVKLTVGIESRWLVILANGNTEDPVATSERRRRKLATLSAGFTHGVTGSLARKRSGFRSGLLSDYGSGHAPVGIEEFSKRVSAKLPVSRTKPSAESLTVSGTTEESKPRPNQTARILQLPAEVDGARSIAVIANGLLAIRMPRKSLSH